MNASHANDRPSAPLTGNFKSQILRTLTTIVRLLSAVAMLAMPASANIINVPGDQPDIVSGVAAAADGDTVLVAPGTYSGNGNTFISTGKNITIKSSAGAASTIIDLGPNTGYFADIFGATTAIQGFTIENGLFFSPISTDGTNNSISDCVFLNNDNEDFDASAINANQGYTTITNCSFINGAGGEAIEFSGSSGLIDHCTFTGNDSLFGGGAIYMNTSTNFGVFAPLTINDCTFDSNTSNNSYGGAIYWLNGALTLNRCTFTNNSSANGGGAILMAAEGINTSITANQCFFVGNHAPAGGVFYSASSSGINTLLTANCVFLNNFADNEGGVLVQLNPLAVTGDYHFTNCSFYGNSVSSGDPNTGILAGGAASALELRNTVMYGDLTSEISTYNPFPTISVIQSDIHGFGGATFDADPQYIDPTNGNLHIPATSPLAYQGTAASAPTIDILGSTRPNPPSIGAYDLITPTHFLVDIPDPSVSYTNIQTAVTAVDDLGNIATGYNGTVTFSSSDPSYNNPGPLTLVNGTNQINGAALKTAGTQTVTATDGTLTGSKTVTVLPGPIVGLGISWPDNVVAGVPFNITVYARDLFGNVNPSYTGTVHFASSDLLAGLPADTTLTNGTGTFAVTLKTGGGQTITVSDSANGYSSTTDGILVHGGDPVSLSIDAPSTAAAGAPFNVTVTAKDQFGNVSDLYGGTIHFTSSDPNAGLPADAALENGTVTLAAYLATVGPQTITATDTGDALLTATANTTVTTGEATSLTVSAPADAVAGSAFNVTVTAKDSFGNTATGYSGTVHFTSTDGAANLPADATLTNGVGTFSTTLNTGGDQTITATDTVNSDLAATSGTITVSGGIATHFSVTAPGTATTGAPFNVTVTALDANNNTAITYTGAIHFTSTDGAASLSADATLTNGAGTFSATLNTAGSQTITATDTVTSSVTGTSSAIAVSQAVATHFSVTAPSNAVAGDTVTVTVSALDDLDHVVPGYAGTVKITTSDGHASLPRSSTLVKGIKTFSVVLRTAMNTAVTATDTINASITGTASVAVAAGPPARFRISLRGNALVGYPYAGNVQATDLYGNPITSYTGTVHFTSTDGAATLPADTTLTNGAANFNAVFYTVGSQTFTATDTVTPSMTSTSVPFLVVGRLATHFAISAPATAVQGSTVNYIVTALDASNNIATGYTGTAHFTSTDGAATLPADATLTNGVGTFPATLNTLGSQTITATDTVTSSITGTSSAITVYSPGASHFSISATANSVAGDTFSITVTALDGGGNIVSNYGGTVHFTSTDGHAVLPLNATLVNGTKTFNVTLRTSGSQTITATDTATTSITGAATIAVAPTVPARYRINLRGNPKVGTPYQFSVQATDIFGNWTPTYTGTVHFTSTDGAATLPADATLSGGIGYFAATFRTVGSQTFTLTDTINASITSTSAVLTVAP